MSRTAMWAVLERAGINGKIRSLLVSAFEKERLSVSVGGRCGPLFRSERGVKAGDSVSPRLFNLVLDAVIRQVSPVCKSLFFYADDGALVASDEQQLQLALDTLVTSLAPFGWEVSASKTKVACFQPAIAHIHVAENAYQGAYLHKPDENYQKFSTKWKEKVQCATCGTMVRLGGLKEHRRTKRCLTIAAQQHGPERTDEAAAFVPFAREVPRGAGGRVAVAQMTSIRKNPPVKCPLETASSPRQTECP